MPQSTPFTWKWLLASVFATLGEVRRAKMTTIHLEAPRPRFGPVPQHQERAGTGIVAWVFATLREWRRRAHDRAELAKLDDRMLRDIGLTHADAEFLSSKPFWRE
jgi:uncharacterized protein YjiS (DUF1127 family)